MSAPTSTSSQPSRVAVFSLDIVRRLDLGRRNPAICFFPARDHGELSSQPRPSFGSAFLIYLVAVAQEKQHEKASMDMEEEDELEEFRLPMNHRPTENLDMEGLEQASVHTHLSPSNIGFSCSRRWAVTDNGLSARTSKVARCRLLPRRPLSHTRSRAAVSSPDLDLRLDLGLGEPGSLLNGISFDLIGWHQLALCKPGSTAADPRDKILKMVMSCSADTRTTLWRPQIGGGAS
ncbi:hypothetical protein PR202_gb29380 [Eleusine coracana subsp. coracana]|uniref:Uncharacterized protein n=1 Tax=Eleusine coracana subsp. coracana TaxID=191504 RepID=A0AAV5FWW8_ELECO|nr:hypothetical protein PR202_gb29380 [Eleusine coracana subsp. coracana]